MGVADIGSVAVDAVQKGVEVDYLDVDYKWTAGSQAVVGMHIDKIEETLEHVKEEMEKERHLEQGRQAIQTKDDDEVIEQPQAELRV